MSFHKKVTIAITIRNLWQVTAVSVSCSVFSSVERGWEKQYGGGIQEFPFLALYFLLCRYRILIESREVRYKFNRI